jgi:hypothetical protein
LEIHGQPVSIYCDSERARVMRIKSVIWLSGHLLKLCKDHAEVYDIRLTFNLRDWPWNSSSTKSLVGAVTN